MSTGINEILDSFSAGQLRDLAFAMSSRGVQISPSGLGKDGIRDLLEKKKDDKTLVLFAHRIEAITPYKHLWIYSISSSNLNYISIKAKIEGVFPGLLGAFKNTDAQVQELEPEACVTDELQSRIYLKLVHQVEMSGWVSVSRTQKELRQFRKRHAVVVTFRPLEGVLTIGFPGFSYTQGVQHEDRMAYSNIAASAAEFLKKTLSIECRNFNAKPAIDALLEEEPDEVIDIKRNVRPQKGGRFAFDAGEEGKLTATLTDYLRSEGGIEVNEMDIRNLFRHSGASDIVLDWKRLQILTRVALTSEGPEFLFVWRGSLPSSSLVDSVLQKVIAYERLFARPGIEKARKEILNLSFEHLVRPVIFAQQFGISPSEVMSIINVEVRKGNFEPRFRVNTDALLVDFQNVWTKAMSAFPKTVTDENGNDVNLTLPSNIEVAFQRVK